MTQGSSKKIAAVSMARDDGFFVTRWLGYYGEQLGPENLFLILDGTDQPLPDNHLDINVIRLPRVEQARARGDRNRSRLVSHLARSLFYRYDVVIGHDIDECLLVDPAAGVSLAEYLQKESSRSSLSGLGLDVGQHLEEEGPIDPSRPFLEQRSYAHVSSRYTKAVVALKPLTWGSGFHRVKGRNFYIDPKLFLFHFGVVDYERYEKKKTDRALMNSGWKGHLDRRHGLFDLILRQKIMDGDDFFRKARRRQSLIRPVYALNKPGILKEKPVIRIPERFRTIV